MDHDETTPRSFGNLQIEPEGFFGAPDSRMSVVPDLVRRAWSRAWRVFLLMGGFVFLYAVVQVEFYSSLLADDASAFPEEGRVAAQVEHERREQSLRDHPVSAPHVIGGAAKKDVLVQIPVPEKSNPVDALERQQASALIYAKEQPRPTCSWTGGERLLPAQEGLLQNKDAASLQKHKPEMEPIGEFITAHAIDSVRAAQHHCEKLARTEGHACIGISCMIPTAIDGLITNAHQPLGRPPHPDQLYYSYEGGARAKLVQHGDRYKIKTRNVPVSEATTDHHDPHFYFSETDHDKLRCFAMEHGSGRKKRIGKTD